MPIHSLICFGAAPGDGNPALVIDADATTAPDTRQAFARERNTTCVWLDHADTVVDFYYPHTRSPLCLHATLAVAATLFARRAAPLVVTTAMHAQQLELARVDDTYFVRLAPQPAIQPALPPDLIARLLAMPHANPIAAPRVASVGSPKLLVEVRDTATLHALAPDLAAIVDWGKRVGVNGLYAYCQRADGQFEGRNFNHLDPRLEDSATGVAAGALSALLGRGLTLHQGRATGRDCVIHTRIDDGAVLVGGRVESL